MSRVNYAFDEAAVASYIKPRETKLRMPMRRKLRNRRYLRGALEAAGLFAFGFGSTALLTQLAAGSFFLFRFVAMLHSLHP
ncbi:MAG: hypothetical protein N2444_05735 [Methylocystis sp.]|nr:hypothetical protein [Methylocystis sp.]